jgi:FixJ family two-component response regulator
MSQILSTVASEVVARSGRSAAVRDAAALPPNGRPVRSAMSQVLIAIVDDEKPVRDATKSLVRSLGYYASTFASADDFLKSEQVHDTTCLITDVQMPGLSGLDLQDSLIARGHCIPIIFMTGYPNDSVRARAMKAGAVGFLHKPLREDHFIGCIEKALKVQPE